MKLNAWGGINPSSRKLGLERRLFIEIFFTTLKTKLLYWREFLCDWFIHDCNPSFLFLFWTEFSSSIESRFSPGHCIVYAWLNKLFRKWVSFIFVNIKCLFHFKCHYLFSESYVKIFRKFNFVDDKIWQILYWYSSFLYSSLNIKSNQKCGIKFFCLSTPNTQNE